MPLLCYSRHCAALLFQAAPLLYYAWLCYAFAKLHVAQLCLGIALPCIVLLGNAMP